MQYVKQFEDRSIIASLGNEANKTYRVVLVIVYRKKLNLSTGVELLHLKCVPKTTYCSMAFILLCSFCFHIFGECLSGSLTNPFSLFLISAATQNVLNFSVSLCLQLQRISVAPNGQTKSLERGQGVVAASHKSCNRRAATVASVSKQPSPCCLPLSESGTV